MLIGVTGHRPNKLGGGVRQRVAHGLRAVFDALGGALPDADLVLVSGLAEGADRIAVEASPPGWALWAILPMPAPEYRRDFTSAEALSVFDALLARAARVDVVEPVGPGPIDEWAARERQYEALARALARQVHALVAVWDGGPAAGPGGTRSVIGHALSAGKPVLWLRTDRPDRPVLVTALPDDPATPPRTEPFEAAELAARLSAGRRRAVAAPAGGSDRR